jgi:ATP adenylyltransferase/5',5'''-P-1,P-4-tetraphosphate phosphorylase II
MGESEVFRIPEYPFQHLFHKLTNQDGLSVKGAYDRLMSELQVRGSYNMILTKSWMLIVPRNKNVSLERFDINALAYAGLIFIKKQEDYDFMKKVGVIEILKDGAFPL